MTPAARNGNAKGGDNARGGGDGARPRAGIRTVIAEARDQLEELLGRPTDAVISVERSEDGWRLCIEVVELERIPASTSILGIYEVQVDGDGNLLEYARTGRYHRNQAVEEE